MTERWLPIPGEDGYDVTQARIHKLGEKLFGGPATTTLERVKDKRWTLTLDVGALQLTWTQPTRREVLAESYGLLSRMAVGT
jgi:hypothetical protein